MTVADFEAAYAADPDPFGVASRWYERRKQQVALASLTRERYREAWDVACGTGHLAVALTGRCESVLATDGAQRAVALTAGLARSQGVDLRTAVLTLPARPPLPVVDLVVLGEVLYYLDAAARRATVQTALGLLRPGGEVLAVHWRHHPHDAHLSGAQVTAELDAQLVAAGLWRPVRHEDTHFTLGTWTRPAAPEDSP